MLQNKLGDASTAAAICAACNTLERKIAENQPKETFPRMYLKLKLLIANDRVSLASTPSRSSQTPISAKIVSCCLTYNKAHHAQR
jgi:hypothetical protein